MVLAEDGFVGAVRDRGALRIAPLHHTLCRCSSAVIARLMVWGCSQYRGGRVMLTVTEVTSHMPLLLAVLQLWCWAHLEQGHTYSCPVVPHLLRVAAVVTDGAIRQVLLHVVGLW